LGIHARAGIYDLIFVAQFNASISRRAHELAICALRGEAEAKTRIRH